MSAIYGRLFGQVAALSIHSLNSISMLISMQNEELMKDPQINTMVSMQSRYLTVWNIGFQMSYFFMALVCDLLTVTGRDHMIPKSTRKFRQLYFATIVFPVGLLIFTIFWPVFLTNRDLLFPEFIDKIFPFKSNFVMHFCIAPFVLWELIFLPRTAPKSHVKNVVVHTALHLVYVSVIITTYFQRGLWPYPLFYKLFGTLYFPVFLLLVFILALSCYSIQWKLTALVWGKEKNTLKKVK